MSKTISIDQLGDVINDELVLYNNNVVEGLKKQAKTSMKELVKRTKATAPVGHRQKHYRDSIKSKTVEEDSQSILLAWYVAGSDYRLSHLLENGHALRNGGRTNGTHFIQNASEPILNEYEEKAKEIVQNG